MDGIDPKIENAIIRTTTKVQITIRDLYDLVYIKKLSDAKIGIIFGLSSKTIRNYRRKCHFETTFKTGRMDLPLSEVSKVIKDFDGDGDLYEHLAKTFKSTKTSVKAFCMRHGINVSDRDNWPITRLGMVDLVRSEYTNGEIASKYSVPVEDVLNLQSKYKLESFEGDKSYTKYGNRSKPDELDLFWSLTVYDRAKIYFNGRFIDRGFEGYFFDGEYANPDVVIEEVKKFEMENDYVALINFHFDKQDMDV